MKPITRTIRARAAALLTAATCVALFGCAHFSGKYEGVGMPGGTASITFKSGSKADLTMMGTSVETDYTVEGDKVTFKNVNGSDLVLTEDKDGTLTGPMGFAFKKK